MAEPNPNSSGWFVYIVESADSKLYTGIATDVERRFREHREGKKGARFFRTTQPVEIVWHEPHPDRSSATKREMAIKKMTRPQKLGLISTQPNT